MSRFNEILQSFQRGTCGKHELLVELENTLVDGRMSASQMLDALDRYHVNHPLPNDVYLELKSTTLKAMNAPQAAEFPRQQPELGMPTIIANPAKQKTDLSGTPTDHPFAGSGDPDSSGKAQQMKHVGDIVGGKYLLVELAGEGGMSRVFKAKDLDAERARAHNLYVAIKVLDESFENHADPIVALNREFQKSTKLNHRNIVNVHHWFSEGRFVYMTMEYLDGKPLSDVLNSLTRGRMTKEDKLRIVHEMGAALAHAHDMGIVHADFKPGNVMLAKDENGDQCTKVIDFGIARVIRHKDNASADKTIFDPRKLGALTPAYASPEMIANRESDPRDDVYSLACVTYELLTGKHPFSRDHALEAKEMGLTVERSPGLNKREWKAICSALKFDRKKRTPTVNKFLEDLNPPAAKTIPASWVAAAAAAGAVTFAVTYFVISERDKGETRPDIDLTTEPQSEESAETEFIPPEGEPQQSAGSTFQDCDTCPKVVVLPKGMFRQGSPSEEAGRQRFEGPLRPVTIDYSIAMSERETTVAEYRAFVEDTGHSSTSCYVYNSDGKWTADARASWRNPGFDQTDDHPVPCVSWNDASAYAAWLSEKTGQIYRLPSESEWEYAARANTTTSRTWGDSPDRACDSANVADLTALKSYQGWLVHGCDDGYTYTAPAASFEGNEFGLQDMQGNLFEWTNDCWYPDYTGSPTDGSPQAAGDCDQRVLRGGSWYTAPTEMRVALRNRFDSDHRSSSFGFRVVRELN